jgi:hypothetical protein
MQTSRFHEDAHGSLRSSSKRNAAVTRPQGTPVLLTASQEREAVELSLELIETRYQEHRARMELEALIAEGEIGCL